MEITKWSVNNFEGAIRASKSPMASNVNLKNGSITNKVLSLGRANRGTGHDNFLHGILVSFDLTCTNKMWVEFERYHFADIVSSQSTMHRIGELAGKAEMYNKYTDWKIIERVKELLEDYHENPTAENRLRLLYSIPSGIELTAQVVTNYGQLKTMWHQRHNHRLPEWREFCDWILNLPYFTELTGITKETKDE